MDHGRRISRSSCVGPVIKRTTFDDFASATKAGDFKESAGYRNETKDHHRSSTARS